MKLTDTAIAGEPIKQSIMVQRLEIDLSEETKNFLLELFQVEPVKHDSLACPVCGYLFRKPNYGAKMDGGINE